MTQARKPSARLRARHRALAGLLKVGDTLRVRVRRDCMYPTLADGQVVEIRRERRYLPGDVLVFNDFDGTLTIHRLLGWAPHPGGWRAMTCADARRDIDVLVLPQYILGRVLHVEERPFRISPAHRLAATGRFLVWLARLAVRRTRRLRFAAQAGKARPQVEGGR